MNSIPLKYHVLKTQTEVRGFSNSSMVEMYHGSDGEYYSADELHRQYESERWKFCMGDTGDGREVVQTETGDLLTLTPLRGGTLGVAPDATADDADDAPREDDTPSVSYVPPAGHCRDCGEPLTVEPCPNCEARKRLDD